MIYYGHGQRSKDHDQEKPTSHFKTLVMRHSVKVDINRDGMLLMILANEEAHFIEL